MKFRYARHTSNLEEIIEFYTEIIGLQIIGRFEAHEKYNGVFIGLDDLDWHLEFTESDEKADHHPDEDDILVFYCNSLNAFNQIKQLMEIKGIVAIRPKNSYWEQNGIMLKDPDGFNIVISNRYAN